MKFRLTATHHIADQLLEAGTVVGDGTIYPITGPSMFMEPLDEEAKKAYEKRMEKWHGKPIPVEIQQPPSSIQPGQKIEGTKVEPPKAAPGPSGMGPAIDTKGSETKVSPPPQPSDNLKTGPMVGLNAQGEKIEQK